LAKTRIVLARRRFGQHFLEPAWAEKLIEAIAPTREQVFLEVGPGRGALTVPLSARARHVFAFEIDRDLAAYLRRAELPHVTVVEGDFLHVSADQIRRRLLNLDPFETLRAAGNLPYNAAAPILAHLLDLRGAGISLADATVLVQREVADRLTATPGTRDYGPLTVLVGYVAESRRLLTLPPGAFRPMPKVHSALVRLRFLTPHPKASRAGALNALVRSLFSRRRKTLANAFKSVPLPSGTSPRSILERAALDGRRRPETLSIPELVRLADVVSVAAEAGSEKGLENGKAVL
jgi:16S rRNA (adenine1518-N6/adenine1519-N6)-dimethyltransferase